jgi:uncharacterized protein YccT (UPF0319 family)
VIFNKQKSQLQTTTNTEQKLKIWFAALRSQKEKKVSPLVPPSKTLF